MVVASVLTFAARLTGTFVGRPCESWEMTLGLFNSRDHRHVAVVIRTDGRRVQIPMDELGFTNDVSLLGLLRSLRLGLVGLLGLITGSGEESGGTRRIGR
jgi:hypothetical protein